MDSFFSQNGTTFLILSTQGHIRMFQFTFPVMKKVKQCKLLNGVWGPDFQEWENSISGLYYVWKFPGTAYEENTNNITVKYIY